MAVGLNGVGFGSSSVFDLSRTQSTLSRAFAQLTSGKRINRAADDAAGLAVASALASSITQISQASRNVSDTVSALSIADGALGQVSDITIRMQELATMAANGTYTDGQRGALQAEYAALSEEIQRIGQTTTFNGRNLLDGSTMSAQIGAAGETLQVGGVNLPALSGAATSQNIGTQTGAQAAMSALEQFSRDLTSERSGSIGASMARLESAQNNLSTQGIAQSGALSQIQDADIPSVIADATKAKVLQSYQVSLIQQTSLLQGAGRLSLLG